MKKFVLSIVAALALFNASAQNQNSNQKLVIDVTSTNFKVYQSVLLTIKIMAESHPNTQFDVIAYGEAVPMLMKERSAVAKEIKKYASYENVSFTACAISMSLFDIKKDELIDGVKIVDNAVDDIIKKQELGWGYIKSGS